MLRTALDPTTRSTRPAARHVVHGTLWGFLAAVMGLGPISAQVSNRSPIPPGWTLAFEDNFDRLRLWDGKHGIWEPHYPWGARTNLPNKELQYYVDPRPGHDPEALTRLAPFAVADGVLTIRAHPIPPAARGAGRLRYASGLLTTARSFSFVHGYAEIRARVPHGRGLWPAFWLIPASQAWPPEIDVMEVLGHRTQEYWASVHWGTAAAHRKVEHRIPTSDLADEFHTFAVRWTKNEITWFLDRREVARRRTPPGFDQPMYLVVNLAVGGTWPGSPDRQTSFPADFLIDYIRVYRPSEAR